MLTYGMLACGVLVLTISVESSGAETEAKFVNSDPLAVAASSLVITRLNVQAASLAVMGCPSVHLSPCRILNVQVSRSGEVVADWARYGTGLLFASYWYKAG